MPLLDRAMTPSTRLLLLAALAPLAAGAAAVVVNVEPGSWMAMPLALRRALSRDALLYTAGAVVLAAPLAGVAAATVRRLDASRVAGATAILAAAAAVFATASAAVSIFVFGQTDADALRLVATSHATMFAVAFALAAFGALCGALLRDPLDAAACSLIIVLIAAGGLLVTGVSMSDVPSSLIDVAVTASPLVAMAASSHIDIARMAVPYQMSPLAHLQVDYPTWYAACAWYLGFAALCVTGMRWKVRSWQVTTVS